MPRRKSSIRKPGPKPAILRPLGAQLRKLRLEREMSQERLAESAGLNYKYVGRLEMAKADPGADVLVRLARALGVPVGELFETITPANTLTDTSSYRLAAADAELMSTALATVTAALERILARQPGPLPQRAPRRTRR